MDNGQFWIFIRTKTKITLVILTLNSIELSISLLPKVKHISSNIYFYVIICQVHSETQKVALRFERACSMHEAAKEMVQLAEQGYMRGEASTDPAWQEMLNHATMKVYIA